MTDRILEDKLERIARALEGINRELRNTNTYLSSIDQSLDVLTELSDCVGVMPPQYKNDTGYKFLRIAGSVDTGL